MLWSVRSSASDTGYGTFAAHIRCRSLSYLISGGSPNIILVIAIEIHSIALPACSHQLGIPKHALGLHIVYMWLLLLSLCCNHLIQDVQVLRWLRRIFHLFAILHTLHKILIILFKN